MWSRGRINPAECLELPARGTRSTKDERARACPRRQSALRHCEDRTARIAPQRAAALLRGSSIGGSTSPAPATDTDPSCVLRAAFPPPALHTSLPATLYPTRRLDRGPSCHRSIRSNPGNRRRLQSPAGTRAKSEHFLRVALPPATS